jgi:hypothetical protein
MKIKLNESFFGKTTIDEIIAELNAPEQLEKVKIFDAETDKVVFEGPANKIPAKFLSKELEGVYMYDAEFVISSAKSEKLKEAYGNMASAVTADGVKVMAMGTTRSTRTYNYEQVTFRFGNKEGSGKYGWQNRPWQRFDFASALQSAMIDAGVSEELAKKCIDTSSDLEGAVECFAKNFKAEVKESSKLKEEVKDKSKKVLEDALNFIEETIQDESKKKQDSFQTGLLSGLRMAFNRVEVLLKKLPKEEKYIKEEADGWIALLDDKKVEIRKGEADSLWGAKKLAIKKFAQLFGRPLSKARELQIVIAPAYDEENLEKAPATGAQFESKKKGLTEKAFVKFDANWELTKALTKEQADALLSFVTKELQVRKQDITTQTFESEKGDLTYLIVPIYTFTDEQSDMFMDFTSTKGMQHQYGHDSEWFVVPTGFKSELIEGVKMYEAPVSKLNPRFDSRQSFYGKARVEEAEDGTLTLISYRTPVAKIKGGKVELLPLWSTSQTTLRHVKEFLKQHGFKAESFAQMSKDYEKKNESIKENKESIIVIAPHMTFQEMKDYCELWQCEVINTGVVGKYKLVGQDAEVVRDELKSDGHIEESMKEEVKTSKGPFTIEYWATEEDREEGFGELFIDSFEDLEEVKQVVKQMVDRDGMASAEALDVNNEVVFGYDGVQTWTEARHIKDKEEQELLEGPDQFGMTDDEFKKEIDRVNKDYGQARKARLKSGNAKIGDNAKIVLFGHKNQIPYSLSNIAFSFSDTYREKNFPHIDNIGHVHKTKAVEEIIRRAPATAEGLAKELNRSDIGHTNWKPLSEDDNSFTIQAEDGFGNLIDLQIVLFDKQK